MGTIQCIAILLTPFFLFYSSSSTAQKFYYGINAGYATVKYSFPVEKDRYHTSDIDAFNTLKLGGSIHYGISDNIRLGTGIQYMSVKGKNDGGKIQGRMINPNGDGDLTFDVNNSFLIFPIELQVFLSGEKIRPAFSGGLQFFKALDQNVLIHIEPDNPDPSYEEVNTVIDKDAPTSYFGAKIGAGAAFVGLGKHEVSLMLYRHFNKSRYETSDPINGIFEKHEISFNMWEVSLGWSVN